MVSYVGICLLSVEGLEVLGGHFLASFSWLLARFVSSALVTDTSQTLTSYCWGVLEEAIAKDIDGKYMEGKAQSFALLTDT